MKLLNILLLPLLLLACQAQSNNLPLAKSTIFFIGDGMGIASLTASRIYSKGSNGKMNFEKFKNIGLAKTYSSDNFVTDSAAAATALASGIKTYNGSIGFSDPNLDPKKEARKLQTIIDVAHRAGKSVGIITTTRVTHATPASFFAHVRHRDSEKEIATQVADSPLTFLLGGGKKNFDANEISNLKSKGWTLVENAQDLNALNKEQKGLKVLGLFNDDHLTYTFDRKQIHNIEHTEPTLAQMLFWGIKTLKKNAKGYLLIVEAGRIDHAGHENHARRNIFDTVALDEAYGIAFEEAGSETLIVSTSDHETGGLAINGYAPLKSMKGDEIFKKNNKGETHLTWATGPGKESKKMGEEEKEASLYFRPAGDHTAVDVLIFAHGPGSQLFQGFMSNHEIPRLILKNMGLEFDEKANLDNYKVSEEAK